MSDWVAVLIVYAPLIALTAVLVYVHITRMYKEDD